MEMPPKKKIPDDFETQQFLRAIKHWTDCFIDSKIKVGIFLNSIQDEAHTYCTRKNRGDEWFEFIRDFSECSEDLDESFEDDDDDDDPRITTKDNMDQEDC